MTRHPTWDLIDVYAATIPTFPFTPGIHVNYASTVLPMKDGLPKLKDFPTELGGSGNRSRNSQTKGASLHWCPCACEISGCCSVPQGPS